MKRTMMFGAALTAALGLATVATAADDEEKMAQSTETFSQWGTSGDWFIVVNEPRNSCIVEKFDAEGNSLQLGLTPERDQAYLGIFMPVPPELAEETQEINLVVGSMSDSGTVHSWQREGQSYTGTYILADTMEAAAAAPAAALTVTYTGSDVRKGVTMDMTGIGEAIAAARQCDAER